MSNKESFSGDVLQFFTVSNIFNKTRENYEYDKKAFAKKADEYFEQADIPMSYDIFDFGSFSIKLNKVCRTTIKWNAKKLYDVLTKKQAKAVIKKRYEIIDFEGLKKYLKDCGVDPTIFKRYICVTESIDEKALDNLFQLGKVSKEEIDGCCEIDVSIPYYKLKKIDKNEDE